MTEKDFSKILLDEAGVCLKKFGPEASCYDESLEVLNIWRSRHLNPIASFQTLLRNKLKKSGYDEEKYIISQRIKRIHSIIKKLKKTSLKLSTIQDIGGLRVILPKYGDVINFRDEMMQLKKHSIKKVDDYITNPKSSGYRSVHIVYNYNSNQDIYNNLQVELQIRTQLQHVRATAVEIIGSLLGHALKSNEGPDEWKEYFILISAYFSHIEGSPVIDIYKDINKLELIEKIKNQSQELGVIKKLQAFYETARLVNSKLDGEKRKGKKLLDYPKIKHGYYLISLNTNTGVFELFEMYPKDTYIVAMNRYLEEEKKAEKTDYIQVLLASSDTFKNLEKAYPNYFIDTKLFLDELKKIGIT